MVGRLTIRKLTAADYEAVGRIGFAAWRSSGEGEPAFDQSDVVEAARSAFFSYPATAKGDVVVAEFGSRVVGWAAREDEPNYISDIWVDPDFQGQGVGSALLMCLVDHILGEGCAAARIDTRASNFKAIQTYERHGFEVFWRGEQFDSSLGVSLEKVHLAKSLR
ncbi:MULTISPECIES: GNAT family N-acetyltransferase [Alphaproteobacteria]|uniref:GNAT family N-acetyltransferase n=1 Tax=Alphaproteobacteria TaxID=28211 RepID=UPI001F242616|nr:MULTISPECIES: GNAT family N-acetyltransferase [Alphaproteobacteria]